MQLLWEIYKKISTIYANILSDENKVTLEKSIWVLI